MAYAVRDIAITSQMSTHKNVLKLIGCCLEFEIPYLIYEDVGSVELLSHSLYKREEGDKVNHNGSLSWTSRLRIANDIAYVVLYLHTAFSTPIILRYLSPHNVTLGQCGAAKLFDFSQSIAILPGKSQVQDTVILTPRLVEPQYDQTGILTEKTDVYNFGMILIELLTGQRIADIVRKEGRVWVNCLLEDYVNEGRLNEIMDTRIRGEGGGAVQEQQLQAFIALAFRCVRKEREDRPEMIDVAKELKRIQRLVQP